MNFDECLPIILSYEGGLVDDPDDHGGVTNFGISLRFLKSIKPGATREDVISLTMTDVNRIYYDFFWKKVKCDQLPLPVALLMFDMAVNLGPRQASKLLQKAVGAKRDGIIGRKTIGKLFEKDILSVIIEITKGRTLFYIGLKQDKFLKGWINRTMDIANQALERTKRYGNN